MQPQNPFQPQQGQPPLPGPAAGYPPVAPQPATPTHQAPTQYPAQPQPVAYGPPSDQPTASVSQYPVDYLNQIATPIRVKKVSPLLVFGLIAGILVTVGLSLFMIIKSTAPPNVNAQLYSLQARLDTLGTVTTNTGPRLTQNNLSSINSTLGTTIKSMQANLKAHMDSKGLKDAKLIAAAKKTEASFGDALSQSLDDAYLTGTLDRSYSSEITYQLTLLKSKLQKLKAAANSASFNDFYDKNVPSLDTVSEQLSKFQNTK